MTKLLCVTWYTVCNFRLGGICIVGVRRCACGVRCCPTHHIFPFWTEDAHVTASCSNAELTSRRWTDSLYNKGKDICLKLLESKYFPFWSIVLWAVIRCSLSTWLPTFRLSSYLKCEGICYSRRLVTGHKTTRCNNPADRTPYQTHFMILCAFLAWLICCWSKSIRSVVIYFLPDGNSFSLFNRKSRIMMFWGILLNICFEVLIHVLV